MNPTNPSSCRSPGVSGNGLDILPSNYRRHRSRIGGLIAILAWALLPMPADAGVELMIESDTNVFTIQWPTNATGFTLQIANQLPPTNGWQASGDPVSVLGDQFVVTNTPSAPSMFFRLFKAQGEAPILSAVTVSTNSITETNAASLQFSYHDPEGNIVALQLVIASGTGVSTQFLAAPSLSLTDLAGDVSFPILPLDLAFSFNSLTLRLIDDEGHISSPAVVGLSLAGNETGGTTPQITTFEPVETTISRPGMASDGISLLRPGFRLEMNDAETNLVRIRLRLNGPPANQLLFAREYSPEALGLNSEGGSAIIYPFEITSSSAPGSYTLTCQAFDRANFGSSFKFATFDVVTFPQHPVQVQSPSPSSGLPGTIVNVPITGLDAADSNAFSLYLGDFELPVLTNESNQVVVEIPKGAQSDKFVLRTTNLVVAGGVVFQVPTNLALEPVYTSLLPGDAVQFTLLSFTNPPPSVTWSVEGMPGGSSADGTISTFGQYIAPANVVSNRLVAIRATLDAQTNVSGIAQVELDPTPATPGTNLLLASIGGRVLSLQGGASISMPSGALVSDTAVSIRRLTQDEYPAPPAGKKLIGMVDLGPDGLVFSEAATVHVPLNCYCPPGSVYPFLYYDPGLGQFVDEGITATVAQNGLDAVVLLPHFSGGGILLASLAVGIGPHVSLMESAVPLEEGRVVPIRLTGSGLDPAMAVTVHPSGGGPVVPGFHVDSWLGRQTNGGFVLTIPVLRDLGEGQTRDFEFQLVNPTQPPTNIAFTVIGLDELSVQAGNTVTFADALPKKWSEVHVASGGTVRIASGAIDWQVTTTTTIDGVLDAKGNDGANGSGINGGAAGRNGGRGMRGSDDTFGVDFDPEPPTGDGDRVIPGGRRSAPQGLGGRRGSHISALKRNAIERLLSDCLDDPSGRDCGAGLSELFQYDRKLDFDYGFDADSLPSGWIGFGAPRHSAAQARPRGGHGGGGGGGSGEVRADFDSGAGGGAGGDGGLGVRIVGRSEINVRGLITTDGGRGGQGARATDGLPQNLGEWRPSVLVLSAGGGGGGSAGELIAVGGGGVFQRTLGGRVSSHGGAAGDGGIVLYDASASNGRPVVFRSLGPTPDGASGDQYVDGPPFTPDVLRDAVTARSLLQLTNDHPLGTAPLEIEIHGEQPGQARTARIVPSNNPEFEVYLFGDTTIQPPARPPYQLNLVLFPGFNTIAVRPVERRGNQEPIADPIYDLLFKRILSLPGPDTDGDGISDEDEVALMTNPNDPDTDGDGSPDGDEWLAGDDPTNADTDGDCVPDPIERQLGTSPHLADSDGDRVWDGIEWMLGFDPVSLPPGVSRTCPITNGPPAGIMFAQVYGKTGGFRLAMLDLTLGRAGAVGSPQGALDFAMAFEPSGDLLFALNSPFGNRVAVASEAYCYEPFPNYPSMVAVSRSGRTATGSSSGVTYLPATNFVGGVTFGSQVGANSHRIDPLATDSFGRIPVADLATLQVGGTNYRAGSIDRFIGIIPYLIGTVLDPSAGTPTGQLFMHPLPGGPAMLLGAPFNRDIKAVARYVDGIGAQHIFGVAEGAPEDELVELSSSGGPNVARVIGPLGYDDVWGLAQHPNGQLYASAVTSSGFTLSSDILLVNPTNAAVTTAATFPKEIFDITFAPCPAPCFGPGLMTAPWPNIRRLAAVDFNQDGYDDLAMIAAESAVSQASALVLMQSDGLGNFQLLTNHVMGGQLSDSSLQMTVADLNNDTWPDLLCKTLFANPPGVMVATNDGAGHFPGIARMQTPTEPNSFDVGELTGDAFPDLVVGIRGRIQLYQGNGDGTFTSLGSVAQFVFNDEAKILRIGDFNNDGLNDFVFAAFLDQRLALNNGAGGFTERGAPPLRYYGRLESTDFDQDGNVDLVGIGLGNYAVYPGDGTGGFSNPSTFRFESSVSGGGTLDFELAELDGNSFPDLLHIAGGEKRIHIWLNQNGTSFTTARQSPLDFEAPFAATVGDFDGNGAPDLAVSELVGGNPNGDHVKVLLGN